MFSDIRNILPKTPASDAKAQQTDTRQEILRHDPEHERQKKNKQSQEDKNGLFGDDLTEVSIDMLDVFLQQILDNYTGQSETPSKDIAVEKEDGTDLGKQVSDDSSEQNQNAQAVGAYARTASYTTHEEHHHVPPAATSGAGSSPQLSASDMHLVYQMQKDIILLKERGVAAIAIIQAAPDESFLQTIHSGMKRALL